MIRIVLALIIALMACFWLILRRLKNLPLAVQIITGLTVSVFFFRTILGETYFFSPQTVFQTFIFFLSFIYLIYLYINNNSTISDPINNIQKISDSQTDKPKNNTCFSQSNKLSFSLNSGDKLFALFMFFFSISACFSVNKDASITALVYFTALYAWYWLISHLPKTKTISAIFQAMLLTACFLLIAYGFYQYNIGFHTMRDFLAKNPEHMIQSREFIRRMQANVVFATFLYAPAFGCYLSMMFLTILGFCLAEGNLFKPKFKPRLFLKYLLLGAIIPMLILTKAKGAWLALLLGLICFICLNRPKTNQKTLLLKPLLGLLSLFGLSFIIISTSDKIQLPKLANFIISFEVRWEYWKATIAMIIQRPLFGFGPGTFGSVYPLFKTLAGEETIMAHNSFLQMWAEAGSMGFFIFVLFWLNFIYQAVLSLKENSNRSRFISIGLFCGIISFLLVNLGDFSLFDGQTALIAFGLMGLLQYHILLEQQDKQTTAKHTPENQQSNPLIVFMICLLFAGVLGYSVLVYSALVFDEKASLEYKNNNLGQALILSDKATNLHRICAKYWFHKAIIIEKMTFNPIISSTEKNKLLNQAISSFETAVKLDPFISRYHFKLGLVLFNSNQNQARQRAGLELKKASDLYPVNPFYHEQLAKYYDIINEPESKEKQLSLAEYLKKFYKTGTR